MGQRLNIEISNKGITLANAYYHWGGYTSSAAEITQNIIDYLKNNKVSFDVKGAIKLLEITGATLPPTELQYAIENNILDNKYIVNTCDRNDGLIGISKEAINETRKWEDGRVTINLDNFTVNFKCFHISYVDEDEDIWELIKHLFYDTGLETFSKIPFDKIPEFIQSIYTAEKQYKGRLFSKYSAVYSIY